MESNHKVSGVAKPERLRPCSPLFWGCRNLTIAVCVAAAAYACAPAATVCYTAFAAIVHEKEITEASLSVVFWRLSTSSDLRRSVTCSRSKHHTDQRPSPEQCLCMHEFPIICTAALDPLLSIPTRLFCLEWADLARFHQEISGLRDDPWFHVVIFWARTSMISPVSIIRFSVRTHFKDPNRIQGIWVELWIKPSRWTQSKSWDTCSAVLAHAHETTDPEWRQRSSCSLSAFKRVEKQTSVASKLSSSIYCEESALPCLSNIKNLRLDSEKVEIEHCSSLNLIMVPADLIETFTAVIPPVNALGLSCSSAAPFSGSSSKCL